MDPHTGEIKPETVISKEENIWCADDYLQVNMREDSSLCEFDDSKDMLTTEADEDPFKCSTCNKSFKHKSYLRKHIKTHSQEKPHKCNECSKSFLRSTNLKRHILTHTEEKPFTCSVCHARYRQLDTLKRHVQAHAEKIKWPISKTDIKDPILRENNDSNSSVPTQLDETQECSKNPPMSDYCMNDSEPKILSHFMSNDNSAESSCLKNSLPEVKSFEYSVSNPSSAQDSSVEGDLPIHVENPFKCGACSKTFKQKRNLRKHLKTHRKERPHKCSKCYRSFLRSTNLKRHILTHSSEKPFTCSVCNAVYRRNDTLKVHLQTHKTEEVVDSTSQIDTTEDAVLSECGDTNVTDPTEADETQQCSESPPASDDSMIYLKQDFASHFLCNDTFSESADLEGNSTEVKSLDCSVNKLTSTQDSVPTQTGEDPFICDICSKTFQQRSSFRNHLSIHRKDKPHKCSGCNKTFVGLHDLRRHSRTHTGEKPFPCPMCSVSFRLIETLRRHFLTHTNEKLNFTTCNVDISEDPTIYEGEVNNITTPVQVNVNQKSSKTPPSPITNLERDMLGHFMCDDTYVSDVNSFKCSVSNLISAQNGDVDNYILTQTKEDPFKCDTCSKSFKQKGNLRKHMKTHTEDKPHKCSTCSKGFLRLADLKRHSITHTTDKPYSCNVCNIRYRQIDTLKRHLQSHMPL